MSGSFIYNEKGEAIHHCIWFKKLLNPFLRRIGFVIVTNVSEGDEVLGYSIRKYPFN
jgi:lipopolysaccharide biosynthesis protein